MFWTIFKLTWCKSFIDKHHFIFLVTYNSLNQSKHIRGIFIQARPYVSNQREDVAVGEFRVDHDPVLKTLTCNSMNKARGINITYKKDGRFNMNMSLMITLQHSLLHICQNTKVSACNLLHVNYA